MLEPLKRKTNYSSVHYIKLSKTIATYMNSERIKYF